MEYQKLGTLFWKEVYWAHGFGGSRAQYEQGGERQDRKARVPVEGIASLSLGLCETNINPFQGNAPKT
jgi:hypothetical protein